MLDLPRLQKTLGTPQLAWILKRFRSRLERGRPLPGQIRIARPTDDERAAVARLFGKRVSLHGALTVRRDELDQLLREGKICDGLESAIEALTGPVKNRIAERQQRAAAWDAVFLRASEQAGALPGLIDWLREARTQTWIRRISRGDPAAAGILLGQALSVLAVLPAPAMTLAELAATTTGDSHALDADRPLSKLVLQATRQLVELNLEHDAAERRVAWDRLGVLVDELSAPVLVLNLRSAAESPLGRALAAHAEVGEPYRISSRQLLRSPPAFTPALLGNTVFVCENPTVVAAAADRLGSRAAPLVCLEGQPKTAGTLLLRYLAAAGIQLRYHGDFDWPGVRIGNLVMQRHGATSWRFDAVAYAITTGGTALRGAPATALWDPDLEPAMCAAGRAVHEEQLLETLLADLGDGRDLLVVEAAGI